MQELGFMILLSCLSSSWGQGMYNAKNPGVYGPLERQTIGRWASSFDPSTAFEAGQDVVDGLVVPAYICRAWRDNGNSPDGFIQIGTYNDVDKCCNIPYYAFEDGCTSVQQQFLNNSPTRNFSWAPMVNGTIDYATHNGIVIVGTWNFVDQFACRMRYNLEGKDVTLIGKWNPGAINCWSAPHGLKQPVKNDHFDLLKLN